LARVRRFGSLFLGDILSLASAPGGWHSRLYNGNDNGRL